MAHPLISAGLMVFYNPVCSTAHLLIPGEPDEDRDQEPEETPETPLDEPPPVPVQDPPAEPEQKGPFVVSAW